MTDKIDTSADLVARLRDHGQHEREEMNHTWRRFRKERLEAADAIDALRAEVERLLATEAAIRADERAKVIAECGQSVTGCIVYDENWARAVDAIDLVHTPDSRAIAEAKSA
jgi:hypothetical protein